MAKQKGRARPPPCRLLPAVQELLQHSPCSHAQLTAVLATATATATLPQPQAVPCRPGGHHEQGPRAFCSLRHSHLFFFSQTVITLRIRKQPTKAYCLLCLNSYRGTNERQPFPGASWRNQGGDPSVPTQEKAPLRPAAWAQCTGHWRWAEPLPHTKKCLRTARLPAWKPSPLPQITALTSPILMKMILLPGEYGPNKTYSKDFSIYFLRYWYLKCAKTPSQHTKERNWVNVNHKTTSAQGWCTGCNLQMCQSQIQAREEPSTSQHISSSQLSSRKGCSVLLSPSLHSTDIKSCRAAFCRSWDLHRLCISSEINYNSVPTGILILTSFSKR